MVHSANLQLTPAGATASQGLPPQQAINSNPLLMQAATHLTNPKVKIFERAEQYTQNNKIGFWGATTSSIDWCEHNYDHSYYVAEWYNTLSNAWLLIVGLLGLYLAITRHLEQRFVALYLGIIVIGLGSTIFHGTLSAIGQQGDETPMLYTTMMWVYCTVCIDPKWEKENADKCEKFRYFLIFVGVVWTVLHAMFHFIVVFHIVFGIGVVSSLLAIGSLFIKCHDKGARFIGLFAVSCFAIGFTLWNIDSHFCNELHALPHGIPNPQFHAWWHALVGLACYGTPVFLIFNRQHYLGLKPKIRWLFYIIPVVDCDKPSSSRHCHHRAPTQGQTTNVPPCCSATTSTHTFALNISSDQSTTIEEEDCNNGGGTIAVVISDGGLNTSGVSKKRDCGGAKCRSKLLPSKLLLHDDDSGDSLLSSSTD